MMLRYADIGSSLFSRRLLRRRFSAHIAPCLMPMLPCHDAYIDDYFCCRLFRRFSRCRYFFADYAIAAADFSADGHILMPCCRLFAAATPLFQHIFR